MGCYMGVKRATVVRVDDCKTQRTNVRLRACLCVCARWEQKQSKRPLALFLQGWIACRCVGNRRKAISSKKLKKKSSNTT